MSVTTPWETMVVTFSAVFWNRQGAFPALTALVSSCCSVAWSAIFVYLIWTSLWVALNCWATRFCPFAQPQYVTVTGPADLAVEPELLHAASSPVHASATAAERTSRLRVLVGFITNTDPLGRTCGSLLGVGSGSATGWG